jgi:hypothetical protein
MIQAKNTSGRVFRHNQPKGQTYCRGIEKITEGDEWLDYAQLFSLLFCDFEGLIELFIGMDGHK